MTCFGSLFGVPSIRNLDIYSGNLDYTLRTSNLKVMYIKVSNIFTGSCLLSKSIWVGEGGTLQKQITPLTKRAF